jgi:hypothetical protein
MKFEYGGQVYLVVDIALFGDVDGRGGRKAAPHDQLWCVNEASGYKTIFKRRDLEPFDGLLNVHNRNTLRKEQQG